jgi:ribose transport system ATP-binding protein
VTPLGLLREREEQDVQVDTLPAAKTDGATSVALRMTGIEKSYGAVKALRGVNLEVRRGEVMALLGENGAGKSTLVKILAGLVTPSAGQIEVDGATTTIGTTQRSQALGIASAEQELSIIGALTVAENLFIGGVPMSGIWSSRRLSAAARPHLDAVGLEHINPSVRAETLSVAERQLVEIARLVANDAKILILDEPTAALSDAEIEVVTSTVTRLAKAGRSIIYVTHRLGEVFEIADRVTVFRGGRSSPAQETSTLTLDSLIEQMIGRKVEDLYPARSGTTGGSVLTVRGVQSDELHHPISLQVRQGEILGIAGQLGSGAGSVLRAIAGMDAVEGGEIEVRGKRLPSAHGLRQAIDAQIAYVSSDRKHDGIFAELSVATNMSAPALRLISPAGVMRHRREQSLARSIADQVAFSPSRLHQRAGQLSGGNQQKVALGKWLGMTPCVLLIHEPTRGVDVGARAEIYRHLRLLADDGMAIVIASSDLEEVHGVADTIITMFRGRHVRTCRSSDITSHQILKDITHPKEETV